MKGMGMFSNGFKHGMCYSRFYRCWAALKSRCNNPKSSHYEYYGGRGITYDSKWNNFLEFKKDMYLIWTKYSKLYGEENLSIERKNINKNYNKENCTFIPLSLQGNNRISNKLFKAISPKGEVYFNKCQTEFAKKFNLTQQGISGCIYNRYSQTKGWRFTLV